MANPMIKAAPAVLTAAEKGLNYYTTRQQQAHELRMAQWQLGASLGTTAMQTAGQLLPRYWELREVTERQWQEHAQKMAQVQAHSKKDQDDKEVRMAKEARKSQRDHNDHERFLVLAQLLDAGKITGQELLALAPARK